jgi:hypothetical protein
MDKIQEVTVTKYEWVTAWTSIRVLYGIFTRHSQKSNWPKNAQKTQKINHSEPIEQPEFCESCAFCG